MLVSLQPLLEDPSIIRNIMIFRPMVLGVGSMVYKLRNIIEMIPSIKPKVMPAIMTVVEVRESLRR